MPKPKGGSLLTSLDQGSCDDASAAVQLFQYHLQASLYGPPALPANQDAYHSNVQAKLGPPAFSTAVPMQLGAWDRARAQQRCGANHRQTCLAHHPQVSFDRSQPGEGI